MYDANVSLTALLIGRSIMPKSKEYIQIKILQGREHHLGFFTLTRSNSNRNLLQSDMLARTAVEIQNYFYCYSQQTTLPIVNKQTDGIRGIKRRRRSRRYKISQASSTRFLLEQNCTEEYFSNSLIGSTSNLLARACAIFLFLI